MLFRIVFILALLFTLLGCEQIKLMSTPPKKPIISHTLLAEQAKKNFWDILHQGNYARLPQVVDLLTAAYLENPHDPSLAAYLGFSHIWKITERTREKNISPTVANEMILAQNFFEEATALNPSDARLQGFLGVSMLASGKIFDDDREQIRGYFQLQRAISLWPEFNYFTAGYPMSDLDAHSDYFKQGLAWQWQTLDLCIGASINKDNPDYRPYMHLETQVGPKRVCWNSWIAPHNFEGFFLNMGDMLVKQGDWQTGMKIYKNAQLSKDYASWPYRDKLERRIKQAKENVAYFQNNNGRTADTRILFNSGYGCAVCHQK